MKSTYKTTSYERRLIFNLRVRGVSESEIADVLDEVKAHVADTGTTAEAGFGTPEEYADQFPKKKKRWSRGATVVLIGVVLSGVWFLLHKEVLPAHGVEMRDYLGPFSSLLGLGMILAGMVAACLTEYWWPLRSNRADQHGG